MNKNYQDVNLIDKNFRNMRLLIPRMSKLISIFFDDDVVRIHYVSNEGIYDTIDVGYEQLTNGFKIVID